VADPPPLGSSPPLLPVGFLEGPHGLFLSDGVDSAAAPTVPLHDPAVTAGKQPVDPALAARLFTARADAAAAQESLRMAALVVEHERLVANALARCAAEAEHLFAASSARRASYGDPGATSSHMALPDLADPVVTQLHLQAVGVQNIRSLVPVVLDPTSTSYGCWWDLVLLILRCYALDDHILVDMPPATWTPAWLRLDSIALSWIFGTLSLNLQDVVRTPGGTACQAWLAIQGQFLGNDEARALCLDVEFHSFHQEDLSVVEYCRRMKAMADSLGELGWPVEDQILVLNVLQGLNDSYAHLRLWIMRQDPFPSFLRVWGYLELEKITRGLATASFSSTTLVAASPSSAAPPAASLLGAPPSGRAVVEGPWRGRWWTSSPGRVRWGWWCSPREYAHTFFPCGCGSVLAWPSFTHP